MEPRNRLGRNERNGKPSLADRGAKGEVAVLPSRFAVALASLREVLNEGKGDEVPEGFFTALAYEEQWKMSKNHCQRLLEEGAKKGKVQVLRLTVMQNGQLRKVRHYRVL